MVSCCRGKEVDPNIEFFDAVEKATFAINNRAITSLLEDKDSNIRWDKLVHLATALKNIEIYTGKELK